MKIRGTAAHIAEKYSTLARDAAASGDSVQAENYLQHAEHYNRIIMAAQAQASPNAQPAGEGANGSGGQRHRRQQGGDDGDRGGNDAFVNGEDMDEAGEPAQQAEAAASEQPSGESRSGKRRRSNGGDANGGGKGADDDAQPSAEDTDSVTA